MIIQHILIALYQNFWFGLVFAVLASLVCLYVHDIGLKPMMKRWLDSFKNNKKFRNLTYFLFYSAMIAMKTLLNRTVWKNPLADVWGVWGLYDSKGQLTTESIENLLLFVPFIFLLLCVKEERIGESIRFSAIKSAMLSMKISFCTSLCIELLQLLLRLGTFQFSDLFFNTLGGIVGGLLYYIKEMIGVKKRNEKTGKLD